MSDIEVKHAFVSAKADGPDTTLIRPSNWNDEHPITLSGPGVVGRKTAGAGPAELLSLYSLMPAGVVLPYAGATLPDGFLFLDGSVVLRADYPDLFTAIGTAFNTGGELVTQFRLPDMRGRVPAGLDNMNGTVSQNRLSPTINSNLMGKTGGNQTATATTTSTGVNTISVVSYAMDGPNLLQEVSNYTGGAFPASAAHTHANVQSSGNNLITVTGTSAAFSTTQPTIVMNYIIKY